MHRFGEKLRALRQRRNLSIRQMAHAFGFSSHSYVARLEAGEQGPSPELILKVADYFNVSLDRLMRDEVELLDDDGTR